MKRNSVILIIGSAPFGGTAINPTYEIAKQLDGAVYKDFVFRSASFPVSRKDCMPTVEAAIKRWEPAIVIGVGLADNRAAVCLERVALNLADFPIPDNDGYLALNEPLAEDGPAAYFSTLPIRACVKTLRETGIPAQVSNTAGNFCCNLTMYTALHYIATHGLNARAGFIHVPLTREMAADKTEPIPTMSFEIMKRAVEVAAQATVDHPQDISMICGSCS